MLSTANSPTRAGRRQRERRRGRQRTGVRERRPWRPRSARRGEVEHLVGMHEHAHRALQRDARHRRPRCPPRSRSTGWRPGRRRARSRPSAAELDVPRLLAARASAQVRSFQSSDRATRRLRRCRARSSARSAAPRRRSTSRAACRPGPASPGRRASTSIVALEREADEHGVAAEAAGEDRRKDRRVGVLLAQNSPSRRCPAGRHGADQRVGIAPEQLALDHQDERPGRIGAGVRMAAERARAPCGDRRNVARGCAVRAAWSQNIRSQVPARSAGYSRQSHLARKLVIGAQQECLDIRRR